AAPAKLQSEHEHGRRHAPKLLHAVQAVGGDFKGEALTGKKPPINVAQLGIAVGNQQGLVHEEAPGSPPPKSVSPLAIGDTSISLTNRAAVTTPTTSCSA